MYYYGARYLDPKYSRWISTDPALGEYIPNAPTDEEAKRHNQNLPGMGGVFNTINANLYHYAGNNPVKYTDPDGRSATGVVLGWIGTDLAIPDPTDVIPWKWVGIGTAILGASIIDCIATKAISNSKTKKNTLVTLYRAVSPSEDASIQQTGTFLNPEGIETKYFSLTKEGANYEADVLSKLDGKSEKYSIYKTAIPKSQLTPDMLVTVGLGVPTVVIPTEKLPLLLPPEKIE